MTLSRHVIDLDGPLHYDDSGGEAPPAVLVHGLAGSAINWLAAADILRRRQRVLALDLAGFGRSPPAGRRADVFAQQRLVDRFIREVAGAPSLLIGNSMGGLISLLQAAAAPDTVSGLVLVDPAAPVKMWRVRDPRLLSLGLMAIPGVGDHLVRRRLHGSSPEAYVADIFSLVCHRPERIDPQLWDAHVELVKERRHMPWAVPVFSRAVRSILTTLRSGAFLRAVRDVRAPTLLCHGSRDRLVSLAAAREIAARRPDWRFEIFDDVGHTPQIECPREFVRTVGAWWDDARSSSDSDRRAPPAA